MSSCRHPRRSRAEDMVVCADCGVVLEADPLVDNTIAEAEDRRRLWTELSGSQLVALTDETHHRNRILHELIRALAAKFSLPETIPPQAIHLVDEAVRSQLVNRGRTGRRAVAILLYLLCRAGESPVPLTLPRIAALCGESPTDLFPLLPPLQALVRRVRGSSNLPDQRNDRPALHLEPLLSQLGLAPGASIRTLLPLAMGLTQFCEERSLVEGRRGEAIALACIIVAAEAIGVVAPLRPRQQKEFVQHCCQTVDLKSAAVTQRIDEIKEALLQEAQRNPLLAGSIGYKFKKATISLLAGDILRHRELGAELSPSVPLAFATSQARAAARSAQIQKALTRIAHPEAVSQEELARLEIDDLIIERLLLHKTSPDRILGASNTGHLCNLEEAIALERDDEQEGQSTDESDDGTGHSGGGGHAGSNAAPDCGHGNGGVRCKF